MKRNSDTVLFEWLLLGAQSGDTDALDQLIRLLYPKLLRYAERQMGDRESAKDIVQSAFEVFSKDLRKISDPSALTAWLYRVTHRRSVDMIRRKQRQRNLQQNFLEEQVLIESDPDGDDQDCLAHAIDQLDSDSYRLVHLYYLEGFSVREVADILRVPQGTIKSRLFQIRKQLKHLVGGNDDD